MKINQLKARFTYWLLGKIDQDTLEEYCIDTNMLEDYYNEEPDYSDDRD